MKKGIKCLFLVPFARLLTYVILLNLSKCKIPIYFHEKNIFIYHRLCYISKGFFISLNNWALKTRKEEFLCQVMLL